MLGGQARTETGPGNPGCVVTPPPSRPAQETRAKWAVGAPTGSALSLPPARAHPLCRQGPARAPSPTPAPLQPLTALVTLGGDLTFLCLGVRSEPA